LTLDLVITILLIGWLAFGMLVTIPAIGKERKPLRPNVAVGIVIIDVLMAIGILHLYWT
jgi:hypothetical protein